MFLLAGASSGSETPSPTPGLLGRALGFGVCFFGSRVLVVWCFRHVGLEVLRVFGFWALKLGLVVDRCRVLDIACFVFKVSRQGLALEGFGVVLVSGEDLVLGLRCLVSGTR